MQLFVKTIIGKTITVDFDSYELKIEEIKKTVEKKTGIPEECQRLISNCRELKNNKSIKDYDIFNEATIHQLSKVPPSICKVCGNCNR